MPPNDQTPEDFDHAAAHLILGTFLNGDQDGVLGLLDQIRDPVVTAAISIRICQQLDPSQIAVFLEMLEDDDGEDDSEDDGEEAETDGPRPSRGAR